MKKIFIEGLKFFLPLSFIILVIYWLLSLIEGLFASIYISIAGEDHYFFGLGLLIAAGIAFCFGLLLKLKPVRDIITVFENTLKKLPLIKVLYRVPSDIFKFFSRKGIQKKGRVALVSMPIGKILGIITTEEINESTLIHLENKDVVAVYFPMSYQIGGYTLLIPRENVEPIDMEVEDALGLIMTAWLSQK